MKTILIIEDHKEMRENTAEILELTNYNVLTAENGRIGVNVAKKNIPDLVLCDVMMPELDGFGVLYLLSKDPATSCIPFVFLTAKADKADIRKGMNLGADDYLTKPFEEMDLLNTIETRLSRTKMLKRDYSGEKGLNEFLHNVKGIEELKELSNNRKQRVYKKKEILYREGDFANCLYFIIRGKVKAIKTDIYGKDLVTDLHNQGEFLGYMPLLENSEYRETATAMDDTEVAIIPKADFIKLIETNRDVATKFIKMLANNILDKEERLLKLAYSSVRERVADALLQLHDKYGNDQSDALRISREDLASIVGTATESLIRTLSEFKTDGSIEISGRQIKIVKRKALERLAGY